MAKFTATLALTRSYIADVEIDLPWDGEEPWTEDAAVDYLFDEIERGRVSPDFIEVAGDDDFIELISCNLEEEAA